MATWTLQRIIATTYVHSALDPATRGMLAHLHALKPTSLARMWRLLREHPVVAVAGSSM